VGGEGCLNALGQGKELVNGKHLKERMTAVGEGDCKAEKRSGGGRGRKKNIHGVFPRMSSGSDNKG